MVCNYQQHSHFSHSSFCVRTVRLSIIQLRTSTVCIESSRCFTIAWRGEVNFFSQNLCNPGPATFQFGIFLRCMETSSLVVLILPCYVTHLNFFSTAIVHSAFLSWSTGLPHNTLQNLIDSSASRITCSCLIFPSKSSYKAFWLFLKALFCWYCFTFDL